MLTETNTLKRVPLIFFFSLFSIISYSQGPDCIVAEVICSDGSVSFTPLGSGIDDFANPNNQSGCMQTNENQSAWYYFEINNNAPFNLELGFTITPNGGFGEDYDFAIFGPGVDCDNLGSPIRCSYADSDCGFCPETGLGNGAIDTSEDPNGDGFVAPLTVNPGDGFFLLVDNWLGSSTGFNMNWTGTGAPYLDCCALNVMAGNDQEFCQQSSPLIIPLNGTVVNNGSGGGTPITTWTGQFISDPTIANPTVTIPADFIGVLNYSFEATDATCTETSNITITVFERPEVEIQSGIATCQTDGSLIAVPINGPAPFSYLWSNNSTSDNINGLSSGTYTVTMTDGVNCMATASFNLTITPPFDIFVLNAENVSCNGMQDGVIEVTVAGGTAPFIYAWDSGQSTPEITNLSGGTYEVVITDDQGCVGSVSVIIDEPLPLVPEIQSSDILCYGDQNGSISVTNINGGVPPYRYSFNGGDFQEIPVFNNLLAGQYSIGVLDNHGCETEDLIEILEPIELLVELGDSETICLGEAYHLEALTNYPESDIASVEWTPAICDGCLDTVLYPLEGMAFHVKLTDHNGCTAEAFKKLEVQKKREVFIPNAFSPNNDGSNDILMVFGGREVEEIESFQIFNRWGETVFSADNFQPNDANISWDGFLKGRLLPNGVYPYFVKIRYIDGYDEMRKGDITLLK